jgi:hypothetical protein
MVRPPQITNEEEWQKVRSETVRIAQGILDKSIGIFEGARSLARLRFKLGAEKDPDLLVFAGIDSEGDQHPLGEVRSRWNAGALARLDAEREKAESNWRSAAERACANLIEKYGEVG